MACSAERGDPFGGQVHIHQEPEHSSARYQHFIGGLQSPGGVSQGLIDIGSFQQGVGLKDPLPRLPTGQQTNNGGDGDPEPSDAGLTSHYGRIVGDAAEIHLSRLGEGCRPGRSPAGGQPELSGALRCPPMAPTTQAAPATTQQSSPPQEQCLLQLAVPYFSKRDSATWQGHRMGFSSTCAMAVAFLRPGCLAGGGQPDDHCLALVERFGHTTDATAQLQAMERLEIQSTFRTDGCIEEVIAQLGLGIPIPVGWLHHGPVSAPIGGGHWSLVVGWDPPAAGPPSDLSWRVWPP